jgi:hypothetical protein
MGDRDALDVKQLVILMIWGEALDPADVLLSLGFTDWQPQQGWRKGDQVWVGELDGSRRLLDERQSFGAIRLWPKHEWLSSDLEGQIQHWSEVLAGRGDELRRLRQKGSTITLQCALLDRGTYDVAADVYAKLGQLGVDFAFEVSVPQGG